jgi:hypothetical protein
MMPTGRERIGPAIGGATVLAAVTAAVVVGGGETNGQEVESSQTAPPIERPCYEVVEAESDEARDEVLKKMPAYYRVIWEEKTSKDKFLRHCRSEVYAR